MKIKSIELRLGKDELGTAAWEDPFGEAFLCAKGVRKYFNIPRGVKWIEVVLHDKPGKNRVSIVPRFGSARIEGSKHPRIIYWFFSRWLESARGEKVYLEVLYDAA